MNEHADGWPEKHHYLTMPYEQVRHAERISERILDDFPDDAVDWEGPGEHTSLVRHSEYGCPTLSVIRFYRPNGENRMVVKHFVLELPTGVFTVKPDRREIRTQNGHTVTDADWLEFIDTLEKGKIFAENLRHLEQKSGLTLGRRAVIDWDKLLDE